MLALDLIKIGRARVLFKKELKQQTDNERRACDSQMKVSALNKEAVATTLGQSSTPPPDTLSSTYTHTYIHRVRVALTLTKRERGPKGLIRTIGFSSSVAIK